MTWLMIAVAAIVLCYLAVRRDDRGGDINNLAPIGDATLKKIIAREQEQLRRELLETETRLQSRS